jgi:hypothetical protein
MAWYEKNLEFEVNGIMERMELTDHVLRAGKYRMIQHSGNEHDLYLFNSDEGSFMLGVQPIDKNSVGIAIHSTDLDVTKRIYEKILGIIERHSPGKINISDGYKVK